MFNLVLTYEQQSRLFQAEELHEQVIEISKLKLQDDHPNTLASMEKLATIYRTLGRSDEAEELEIKLLKIRKEKLGANHPDAISSMASLAWTQGRIEEAKGLEMQAAELRRRAGQHGWPNKDDT